jgi:hypothetical protein
MTDNEPPGSAPSPEDSSVPTGEPESAPPQPPPAAPRLGAILGAPAFGISSPIVRSPILPIQVPVSEPSIGPTVAGQPVLRVGAVANPVLMIDVGDQAAQAAITRDGAPVPVIDIPQNNLQNLHLVPPVFSPRVVSQSVPAGTRVPQGASVDLVLASPFILPISIIPKIHPYFLGPAGQAPFTLAQVYTQFIQNNAGMRGVLTRNTTAPDISSADGQAIVQAFQALSPPVTLSSPDDVAGAFTALQAAMTFGS